MLDQPNFKLIAFLRTYCVHVNIVDVSTYVFSWFVPFLPIDTENKIDLKGKLEKMDGEEEAWIYNGSDHVGQFTGEYSLTISCYEWFVDDN